MLHAQARRAARRDALGGYVPLAETDPAQWDEGLIDDAETLLRRAGRLGEIAATSSKRGAIGACGPAPHRPRPIGTRSHSSIDALLALTGSPVVAINPRGR